MWDQTLRFYSFCHSLGLIRSHPARSRRLLMLSQITGPGPLSPVQITLQTGRSGHPFTQARSWTQLLKTPLPRWVEQKPSPWRTGPLGVWLSVPAPASDATAPLSPPNGHWRPLNLGSCPPLWLAASKALDLFVPLPIDAIKETAVSVRRGGCGGGRKSGPCRP